MLNTSSSYFKQRYERGGYIRKNIKHLDTLTIIKYLSRKFLIEKDEIFEENGIAYGIKGRKRNN